MRKKTLSLSVMLIFTLGCASTPVAPRGPVKPKSIVTPWQYYQKTRPAIWTSEDKGEIQKTAVHSTGEDTKSDKTGIILIGVLVGVVAVGGAVTAILLTR